MSFSSISKKCLCHPKRIFLTTLLLGGTSTLMFIYLLSKFQWTNRSVTYEAVGLGTIHLRSYTTESFMRKTEMPDTRERYALIHLFNASKESPALQKSVADNECVLFHTPRQNSQICVYSAEKDMYISGSLINGGMWERDLVTMTANALNRHPNMMLLDLGCNIGVFTIYCASMGKRVISVDANKENLLLLSRSLAIGNLQQNVTMIWNAISDTHENVTLKGYEGNVGGSYVQTGNDTNTTSDIVTIKLDDLIPLLSNKSVFIKMDIETFEWKCLNGGRSFFETVDVGYVLMEFSSHRTRETGKHICDFMSSFGFRPYKDGNKQNVLKVTEYSNWPDNVLWSKF